MMRLRNVTGLALLLATVSAAQLSPRMTTSVTVDGKKITIGYGAPSARGRKIMGGLVPYGEVWCTGANDATSLDTEADLDITSKAYQRLWKG